MLVVNTTLAIPVVVFGRVTQSGRLFFRFTVTPPPPPPI
jgi:hypothetical protein